MKHDLRIAVTKKMIRDALLQLLEDTPLERITVSRLCDLSGVNRTTFYRHYQTLQDVLREQEAEFLRNAPRPASAPKTMAEAQSYLETICTYFYENARLTRLLILSHTDTDLLEEMHRFCRSCLELRKAELPAPMIDEDTRKAVFALIGGGVHCLLRQWILGQFHMTPGQVAQILCSVIRWPRLSDLSK